jgi:GNAT superfamily N-acetyltransferase
MLIKIMIAFNRIREILAEGNLWNQIQKQIFWNRIATPVEMELTTLPLHSIVYQDTDYQFIELKLIDLKAAKWSFPISSRRLKALHNLKKGWRSFAIIMDSTVVGDVWCIPFTRGLADHIHPDIKMLGIRCGEGEAYTFDMLIHPTYRGKNLAVPLHRNLQMTLKNEGYRKVYGYYWDDNLPALWMHRMVKFHELPKRRVSRFFSLLRASYVDQSGSPFQDSMKDSRKKSIEEKS